MCVPVPIKLRNNSMSFTLFSFTHSASLCMRPFGFRSNNGLVLLELLGTVSWKTDACSFNTRLAVRISIIALRDISLLRKSEHTVEMANGWHYIRRGWNIWTWRYSNVPSSEGRDEEEIFFLPQFTLAFNSLSLSHSVIFVPHHSSSP